MIRDGWLEAEIRRLAEKARQMGIRVEPCCDLTPPATDTDASAPISLQRACPWCFVECGRGLVVEYRCPGGQTHCACRACAQRREELHLAEFAEAREREEKLWAAMVAVLPPTWKRVLKRWGAKSATQAWAALSTLAPALVKPGTKHAASRGADAIAAEIGPVLWGEIDDPVLYEVLEDYPDMWTVLVGTLSRLVQLLGIPEPELPRLDAEQGHQRPTWMVERPVRGPPHSQQSQVVRRRRSPVVAVAAAVFLFPWLLASRPERREPSNGTELPVFLTSQELVDLLKLPSIRVLDSWSYRGVGPQSIRVGRHRRYLLSDVTAWIEAQRRNGRAPARRTGRGAPRAG